jgi:hypothetical protein
MTLVAFSLSDTDAVASDTQAERSLSFLMPNVRTFGNAQVRQEGVGIPFVFKWTCLGERVPDMSSIACASAPRAPHPPNSTNRSLRRFIRRIMSPLSSSSSTPKTRRTWLRNSASATSAIFAPSSVSEIFFARRSSGSGSRRTSFSRSRPSMASVTVRGAWLNIVARSVERSGPSFATVIKTRARAADIPLEAKVRSITRSERR